jgi:GT2 family glycosyltransferase
MRNNPLVSTITPTYNRKKLAERAVRSILKSSYNNIEVIVVDDASPDNTIDYLKKKFANNNKVKIFRNKKNLFAAGTKNEGQKRAKGDFFLFVDDDNVLDPKMIENLVQVFKENPEIGELGPVNYNYNKKTSILMSRSTRNMWTTKTLHLRKLTPFKGMKYWPTDDVPNSFMVRSEIVKKNKIKFRSQFGIMYEESDYAYRIKKAGYQIRIVRNAKVYHDIEDSSIGQKKDYLYHFMEDKRRPYVFARNRIIFHKLYSNNLQFVIIMLFWIWSFTAYYMYKFIFYKGYGRFSLLNKISTAWAYMRGTFNGVFLLISSGI